MGRILGIDYGDIRIGLALSDRRKCISFPYKTLKNKNEAFITDNIKNIIIEKDIEYLVLGLPIGLNGNDTQQTKKIRKFADFLRNFKKPVYLHDERLSSISAIKSLVIENIKTGYSKEKIDVRAATILLQHYIDCKNTENGFIK